jgi:molybdopterin-guanine dinucleotide biosynthesis protein A
MRTRGEAALTSTVVAFIGLFYGAARAYPGGTHFDHTSVGHDLWRNTLCDVTRTTALDGRPNGTGCTLARIAMIVLAGGLGIFFALIPRLFRARARTGMLVRALGSLAAVGAVAVVLLPSDRFGAMHGVAVVSAGIPGLAAALLSLHAVLRERAHARAVVVLGSLALGVATVDFALYVSELLSGGASQLAVSVLERIATALLLAWMLAVAHEAYGAAPETASTS